MKLTELFEARNEPTQGRVVAIYPGRFQPPTPAHVWVYKALVGKFGANNVYISMSDSMNPETSPLSYDERKMIFTKLLGVPENKIIKVTRQYNTEDVAKVVDIDKQTALIFAVGQKDMTDNPRFKFTKDSYVQNFYDRKASPELTPYTDHMYIMALPTQKFNLGDKAAKSATQLRKLFKQLNTEGKKRLFVEIYGKFDASIFNVLRQKLA